MSGLEVDVIEQELAVGDGPQAIMKPTVEVVFDTNRTAEGEPTDESARGRIARGIAALQKAGGGVGKVAAEAKQAPGKAVEAAPVGETPRKGLDVAVVEPGEAVGEALAEPKVVDEAAEAAKKAEIDAAKVDPAVPPELEQAKVDLAVAQARIEALSAGDISDEDRTVWIEKPVDWIRAETARRMGVKADDPAVAKALAHFQWALTIDLLGAELPKDIKERNDTEHVERSKALTKAAQDAQGAAKTQAEGRSAVHKLVTDQLAASADKFPYAAAGADLHIGGIPASQAAILLWADAVKRGEVKNTGDDAKDIPEALRLYDKFCKTRLGSKFQLQNATPPPANTPAASKEAATGAKGKPPTLSAKDAAAAPAAKKVDPEPQGPERVDASDSSGRYRRVGAVARKHFASK